jgi:tRNA1(Val) A37 N6-methylase TrmN6
MRLAAQAKMGYYPTPDNVTSIVTRYLKRRREGLIRVLDPCAGEGTAIHSIGEHLKAETYGVELDLERGEKAKNLLTRCLITDYRDTRVSHSAFSLLWLNPPYDWGARNSELETSERYERTFLRDCIPYLSPGGILVYLIPQRRLDGHIARMLSYRFEHIEVFRFPELEYTAFRQLVIIGVLKKRAQKDDPLADYLKKCGEMKAALPYLPQNPKRIYEVPLSPAKAGFVFRSKDIIPEELSREILEHGLFPKLKDLTAPLGMVDRIRPVMPLRHGHLAQILACGLMNGVLRDRENKNPLLVKGITRKEVKRSVEIEGDLERHIDRDQIRIMIRAFNQRGDLLTIE